MLPRRKARVAFWERRTATPLYGMGIAALLGGLLLLPQPGSADTAYTPPTPHTVATVAPAIILRPTPAPIARKAPPPAKPRAVPTPAPTRRKAPAAPRKTHSAPAPRATHTAYRRTTTRVSGSSARAYAQSHLSAEQFACIDAIFTRESGWSTTAENPSGAFGIPQALPGSKMASAGADWATNGATQVRWGISYMDAQYGSPCGAWDFWQAHHWY